MKIREDTQNNILDININEMKLFDYQIEMLTQHKNLNILNFIKVRENEKVNLSFNLDTRVSLKKYLMSKKFCKEEVLNIIVSVLSTIDNSDDYLLYKENFLLDVDFMYYNLELKKVEIIYIPVDKILSKNINEDIKGFIKTLIVDLIEFEYLYEDDGFIGVLLTLIRQKDIEMKTLKVRIENLLKQKEVITSKVKGLESEEINFFGNNFLIKESEEEKREEKRQFKSEDLYAFIEDRNEVLEYPILIKLGILGLQIILISIIIALVLANLKINILALVSLIFILIDVIIVKFLLQYKIEPEENFNSKEDISVSKGFINIGKKQIMSQNVCKVDDVEKKGVYFLLVNDEITERLYITKNNFIIGRYSNECDYVINNNTVGKKHLKVVKKGEEVYIEDLNSKNGTYINGERIKSGKLYMIEENFEIKISNVLLTFKKI